MKRPHLSVIIPVYNETARLGNITQVIEFLRALPFSTELIVVDDGSTDDTLAKLKKLQKQGLRLLHYLPNRGKGHALRTGMLEAHGRYRLFMDVDLSVPLEAVHDLLPHLDRYDIVFGTRKRRGAKVTVKQSALREWLGKGFTWLSSFVLGLRVSDFTCGFKAYSAEAAQQLFAQSRVHRWGFDSELMFLAHKYGLSLKEVPVTWKNDPRTTVRFPHDIFRSLHDLVAVRWHDLTGRYS